MKRKYPEQLADGRVLLVETLDLAALGANESAVVYTPEGVAQRSFRLDEAKAPSGTLGFVEGIAAKSNIVNRNRRFYSQVVFEAAVERAQGLLTGANFLGEVDHPDAGSLDGAAFRFTRLWMDGDLMRFEGVVLDTEGGRHLRGLLRGGVGVQVSTRGYASSKPERRKVNGVDSTVAVIGSDLTFEGIDFVLFASNPAGKVTGATTESAAKGTDSPNEETAMTLAELREKHAALVAELEAEARTGHVPESEVEAKVTAAVEAAVEAAKVEALAAGKLAGAAEALESAEVTGRKTALEAVIAAVAAFVPAAGGSAEKHESEETDAVAALEAKLACAEAQLKTIADAKAESERIAAEQAQQVEAERVETERKTALEAKVTALLTDFAHADLIKPMLLAAESADAAEKLFNEQKDLLASVEARALVQGKNEGKTGTGTVDGGKPESQTESEQKDPVLERQRRIAYEK